MKDWAAHIEDIYVQVNSMFPDSFPSANNSPISYVPTDEEKTIKFIIKSQN